MNIHYKTNRTESKKNSKQNTKKKLKHNSKQKQISKTKFKKNSKQHSNKIKNIYRGWLLYFHNHMRVYAYKSFFRFQNLKSRSEPLDVISILKYALRPNFKFSEFFYYLLSYFEND